eukprot:TRINITY_DN31419_c0_g1_i1.p1 TRINITY_DN31419_c0_g1~~TRINITY_DN31419_c0_g1_i1.p1  ORF type:complete len:460 (-),score=54.27 TRINITY_DN31419_c0_g1_i1:120-1442(-)
MTQAIATNEADRVCISTLQRQMGELEQILEDREPKLAYHFFRYEVQPKIRQVLSSLSLDNPKDSMRCQTIVAEEMPNRMLPRLKKFVESEELHIVEMPMQSIPEVAANSADLGFMAGMIVLNRVKAKYANKSEFRKADADPYVKDWFHMMSPDTATELCHVFAKKWQGSEDDDAAYDMASYWHFRSLEMFSDWERFAPTPQMVARFCSRTASLAFFCLRRGLRGTADQTYRESFGTNASRSGIATIIQERSRYMRNPHQNGSGVLPILDWVRRTGPHEEIGHKFFKAYFAAAKMFREMGDPGSLIRANAMWASAAQNAALCRWFHLFDGAAKAMSSSAGNQPCSNNDIDCEYRDWLHFPVSKIKTILKYNITSVLPSGQHAKFEPKSKAKLLDALKHLDDRQEEYAAESAYHSLTDHHKDNSILFHELKGVSGRRVLAVR